MTQLQDDLHDVDLFSEQILSSAASLRPILARLQAGSVPSDPSAAEGLDVSKYQGVIDWNKIKGAGKDFVFIKATEGSTGIDPFFAANWLGSKSAGIPRGAYHYFHFGVEVNAQAQKFYSTVSSRGDLGEMPPMVDVEDTSVPQSMLKAATLKAFLDAVTALFGRKPVIYTGAWFWGSPIHFIDPTLWAADYDLAEAAYIPAIVLPAAWKTWRFWQWTSHGTVDGLAAGTFVDLDHFNGTVDDLRAWMASH